MMRNVLFALACVVFMACTPSASRSVGAVQDMGFDYVDLGSRAWVGCPEDHSTFTQHFTARRSGSSRLTNGIVCCGFWSCTVRLTR
ncbi:MAG: hypothetical protein MJE68_11550 [Proteobacteria bacterium]|nr:hypothetical protein [Pseudomonadota bacterium]